LRPKSCLVPKGSSFSLHKLWKARLFGSALGFDWICDIWLLRFFCKE